MRHFLALSCLAIAASSWSVFDLQKVNRFSSSGLVDSGFTYAVPKGDGGFIAVGEANQDILIVDFDSFGGIIKTALYDSPLVESDTATFLGRYADGRLLIATLSGAETRLVQLSPGLTVNWEIARPLLNTMAALDGSGNAYLATSNGIETFSAAGVSKGTASVSGFTLRAITGAPGTAVKTAVMVGRNTGSQQPRAIRLTDTATIAFDYTDTTLAAASGSTYICVDVESDGDSIAGGAVGSTNSTTALFSSISAAGTAVSNATATGSLYERAKIRNSTEAFASLQTSTGDRMCRITRSNSAINQISPSYANGIRGFAELARFSHLVCSGNDEATYYINQNTMAEIDALTGGSYLHMAAVSSDLVIGVREIEGGAAQVAYYDGGPSNSSVGYRFPGAPNRSCEQSVKLPDGSVAMLVAEESSNGAKLMAVRYSAAGALIYAKTFNFANESLGMTRLKMVGFPDGSISVACRLGNRNWGFGRVSNSGVVTAVVHPFFSENFQPVDLVALPDGSTALFSVGTNDAMTFTRLSATGSIIRQHAYADLENYQGHLTAPPIILNSGNIVLGGIMADNSLKLRAINPNTGAAGTILTVDTVASSARIVRDSSGDVLIAYSSMGGLKFQKRSGTNLATVLGGATGGFAQEVRDAQVAPNGNLLVLCQQTGDDQLRFFGLNFAHVVTATLPATIVEPIDIDIDANNITYVAAEEQANGVKNGYAARYLANGVRSAQRRTAAKSVTGVHVAGSGVWVTGSVGTRKKGTGPFAARYSL